MSRSTRIPAERWCVEVNKDGEEHQQRKHDGCPESTVSHHNWEQPDPVLWHGRERGGVSRTRHTHTALRVRAGWRRSKSKTGLVVLPIFLPFSLLLLFHRAPRWRAGNMLHWGELPDGCMNNIFGHNGKQSIGRLICSGPRIGSNRTAAIQAITARVRPITWGVTGLSSIPSQGSADLLPIRGKHNPADINV